MRKTIGLISIWLLIVLSSSHGELLEVVDKTTLTLNCNDAIRWYYHANGLTSPMVQLLPSNRFGCVNEWSIDNQTCAYKLIIDEEHGNYLIFSPIEIQDAAIYVCESRTSNRSYEVTVVSAVEPVLEDSLTELQGWNSYDVEFEQEIQLACFTTFSGFRKPSLQLLLRTDTGIEQTIANLSPDTTETYHEFEKATISANFTVFKEWGSFTVICQLGSIPKFLNANSSQKTFKIVYGPIFQQEVPAQVSLQFTKFGILNCSAESYPFATYSWFQRSSSERKELGVKNATYKVETVGFYECAVKNPLSNRIIRREFDVTGSPATSPVRTTSLPQIGSISVPGNTNGATIDKANNMLIGVIVGSVVILIAIVGIVLVFTV